MPQTQRFADFELRPAERVLLRAGQPLPLGSRAFDLLLALVRRAGPGGRPQVCLDTLMVGNLAEKSLALSAIFTATWRATAL